jgi:hypothetical protein
MSSLLLVNFSAPRPAVIIREPAPTYIFPQTILRVPHRMPGLGGGVRFFGGYKLLRWFGISRMGKLIGVNLII